MANGTRFAVFYNVFGSNSIDLKVLPTSYSQWLAGGTQNTRTAAGVVDRILASDQAGTATVAQDQLLYVSASQTVARLPGFVQALAGEVHGAMAAAAPQAGQRLNNTVVRQLADAGAQTVPGPTGEPRRRQALWVDIGVDHGRWDGDRSASQFTTNRSQFVLGADMLRGESMQFGVGFSYSNTNVGASAGSGSIEEYMGFAYGQASVGPVQLDGMAGYGTNTWDTQRSDPTGLSSGALKTDASGHSTQVGLGLRTPFMLGSAVVEPFARVLWQKSTRGGTDEGNASPAALSLSQYSATGNRVTLGLSTRSNNRNPLSDTLTYQFSAGLGRDNGNLVQSTVQANLAGIGMGIVSPGVGRLFGLASFTGTLRLGKQAYAYLGLNGEVRSGKNDVGVNGGMRVSF
jgi:outer membrane autotransporter protein